MHVRLREAHAFAELQEMKQKVMELETQVCHIDYFVHPVCTGHLSEIWKAVPQSKQFLSQVDFTTG